MDALSGKRVAIIGRLQTCPRRQVVARLEIQGGLHQDKVNTLTDIVVLPIGEISGNKQVLEAEKLQNLGKLRILREDAFIEMLNVRP